MTTNEFLSDYLPAFRQKLELLERRVHPEAPPDSDQFLEELTQTINDSLHVCTELEDTLRGEDPAVVKDLQKQYREAIWPVVNKSWVMDRSITKPRGYPGDYQLLTAIYDGVPKSTGFGGYLDRFLLNLTLGRAVCARMWAARRFLMNELARRQGQIAILNVASGACREYLGGFEPSNQREVTLTCVDADQEALDFAQSQTDGPLSRSGITSRFIKHNALRMVSAASNVRRFGASDIIYSIGLCDYIPDEYLIPLMQGLRESLKPGGVVYIAFKDTLLYDKAEYQWLLDWYFFPRTEEDCLRVFATAGYDVSQIEVTRDSIGVIMNFLCRDKVADAIRVDQPEQLPTAQHVDSPAQAVGDVAANHIASSG
jgi:extracellular factor (EF) 3-hydroxypalmitic acid methyl ester biosynthesis protein